MAFVPKNAQWYVGEFVESIRIGDPANFLVHVNTCLIEASSPEDALQRALALGGEMNIEYFNTEGVRVVCRFEGLQELNVIHDELAHGTELFYREYSEVEEGRLRTMVTAKESLAVFRDMGAAKENYFPQSIADELKMHTGPRSEPADDEAKG